MTREGKRGQEQVDRQGKGKRGQEQHKRGFAQVCPHCGHTDQLPQKLSAAFSLNSTDRQRQKLKDTPSPQRRKPPACLLTVFCEIFIPDRVTDCKSLDTLDAGKGGSSHEHSPQRQRSSGLKFKQTMTVAVAQIFQECAISRINLPPKLPLEVGVNARGRRLWYDRTNKGSRAPKGLFWQ